MTIRHHPSDDTLARYAAGSLEAGLTVVTAVHVGVCAQCEARVAELETIGGALVEGLTPAAMEPEALARTLAMIDEPPPASKPRSEGRALVELPPGVALPRALRGYPISRWRWIAPGARWSRVTIPGAPKANVTLLRIAAGKKLIEHGHDGVELTQVLYGSFSDGHSRYRPGDLLEADADFDHLPVADPDGECICIAAVEGGTRLRGMLGRLLPFVRL